MGCHSGSGCGTKTEGWKAVRIQKAAESKDDRSNLVPLEPKAEDDEEESEKGTLLRQMGTLKGNDIWEGSGGSTWDHGDNCDSIDNALEALLLAQEQGKKPHATPPSEEVSKKKTCARTMTAELWPTDAQNQQPPSPPCFELEFVAEPEQPEEEVTDSAIESMISSYKAMEDDPYILAFLEEREKAGLQHKQQQEENALEVLINHTSASSTNVEKYEKTPAAVQATVEFQQVIQQCPAQVRQAGRADNGGNSIASNVVLFR